MSGKPRHSPAGAMSASNPAFCDHIAQCNREMLAAVEKFEAATGRCCDGISLYWGSGQREAVTAWLWTEPEEAEATAAHATWKAQNGVA